MKTQIHLFGSGLGADRAEEKDIQEKIKMLDKKSDFTFAVVSDIEEVKRGLTSYEVKEVKEQARKRSKDLLDILNISEELEKFTGLIVRINPYGSPEYVHDVQFFGSLSDKKRHLLQGVYVPDFDNPTHIQTIADDLGIDPWKIMPIIENDLGHENLHLIAKELLNLAGGNDVYVIGSGDAYHRFLDRAKNNKKGDDIQLTPDTLFGEDKASKLAYDETVEQLRTLGAINKSGNIQLMLSTSTLVDSSQYAGDLTAYAIDYFNDIKYVSDGPTDFSSMQGHIGKVAIDPAQLVVSDVYKMKKKLLANLEHGLTVDEIIETYLKASSVNKKPVRNGYIILDAQFYIALLKKFIMQGVFATLVECPLLKIYMGSDSSLLLEDVFIDFKEDIVRNA